MSASVEPIVVGKGPTPAVNWIRVRPDVMEKGPSMTAGADCRVESVTFGISGTFPRARVFHRQADVSSRRMGATWLDFRTKRTWTSHAEFEDARRVRLVGVRWVAPFFDESPYGEAARNHVSALAAEGIPVSSRTVFSTRTPSSCWPHVPVALNLGLRCAINVVHSTPAHFRTHRDPVLYNVGLFACGTTELPKAWVAECNAMDEIWVPCQRDAEICARSGVKRPVNVVGRCPPDKHSGLGPLLHWSTESARVVADRVWRTLNSLVHVDA